MSLENNIKTQPLWPQFSPINPADLICKASLLKLEAIKKFIYFRYIMLNLQNRNNSPCLLSMMTYRHSTMKQERLNQIMTLHIYKE